MRIRGQQFRPKVFNAQSTYALHVGEPGAEGMQTLTGLRVTDDADAVLAVVF